MTTGKAGGLFLLAPQRGFNTVSRFAASTLHIDTSHGKTSRPRSVVNTTTEIKYFDRRIGQTLVSPPAKPGAYLYELIKRERIQFEYKAERTTSYLIGDILAASRASGKEGPVAQYLVGAKLQLRFPEILISNESYSPAVEQTRSQGVFTVQDTVFYVIVAPMTAIYAKCAINLSEGKSVCILIPARSVEGARLNADNMASGRIDVAAIESFVGFNVNEIAMFGKGASAQALLNLLEIYNSRVSAVETDLSLMIEIPKNLSG